MQTAPPATGPVSRSHGAEFYSIQMNALKTPQIVQLIENKRWLNLLDPNRRSYSIQMDHRASCRLAQRRVEGPGRFQFNPELQCCNRLSPRTNYHSRITNHVLRLKIVKKPTNTQLSAVLIGAFLQVSGVTDRAVRVPSGVAACESRITIHASFTHNSLGSSGKPCYGWAAFVALVTPLDSMKGLQAHTCGLFCFTAGGGREANK
jgi:hypothetical protein